MSHTLPAILQSHFKVCHSPFLRHVSEAWSVPWRWLRNEMLLQSSKRIPLIFLSSMSFLGCRKHLRKVLPTSKIDRIQCQWQWHLKLSGERPGLGQATTLPGSSCRYLSSRCPLWMDFVRKHHFIINGYEVVSMNVWHLFLSRAKDTNYIMIHWQSRNIRCFSYTKRQRSLHLAWDSRYVQRDLRAVAPGPIAASDLNGGWTS